MAAAAAQMSSFMLSLRKRYPFIQAQALRYLKNLFHGLNDGYYRAIRKSILLRSTFAPGLELVGFVCFALALFLIDEAISGPNLGRRADSVSSRPRGNVAST